MRIDRRNCTVGAASHAGGLQGCQAFCFGFGVEKKGSSVGTFYAHILRTVRGRPVQQVRVESKRIRLRGNCQLKRNISTVLQSQRVWVGDNQINGHGSWNDAARQSHVSSSASGHCCAKESSNHHNPGTDFCCNLFFLLFKQWVVLN